MMSSGDICGKTYLVVALGLGLGVTGLPLKGRQGQNTQQLVALVKLKPKSTVDSKDS